MIAFDPNFDIIFQNKVLDYLVNQKFVFDNHKNINSFAKKKGGLLFLNFHFEILISVVNFIFFKNICHFFEKKCKKI